MIFLDTNIFLRFYLRDAEDKAKRCKNLLQDVASGKERAMTSTMVIAEIVWVLERTYQRSRKEVTDFVMSLLALPHLVLKERRLVKAGIASYADQNIDFIDAYNAALMSSKGVTIIYTYDRHFARVPSVQARKP